MHSFDSVIKAFTTKVTDYKVDDGQGKRKVHIWTVNPRCSYMMAFYENSGNFFVEEENGQLKCLIKKKVIDRELLKQP